MSFTIKGIHPHDIATILDDDGVAIRVGHPVVKFYDKLGIPASARASIGVYNIKKIWTFCVSQLINVKRYFKFKWN